MKAVFNKLMAILCLCSIFIILLSGCGSSKQVPDSLIEEAISLCEYYDPSAVCNWTATHSIDNEAHIDTVFITVILEYDYGTLTTNSQVKYQYDRASDLWFVFSSYTWSRPTYIFNDNLIGDWHIDWFSNEYDINVRSIKNDKITLDCYINEEVYGGIYAGTLHCKASGGGTFYIDSGGYVSVPINLPDSFYVSWSNSKSGNNETHTNLKIVLDPQTGVQSAYVNPEIDYRSN